MAFGSAISPTGVEVPWVLMWSIASGGMPASFTASDLASALGRSRAFARKMVYCLSSMGAVARDGKRGRAALYRQLLPSESVSA